jgi:hypothetical protein
LQQRLNLAAAKAPVRANPDVLQFTALAEIDHVLTGRPQQRCRLRGRQQLIRLYRHVPG